MDLFLVGELRNPDEADTLPYDIDPLTDAAMSLCCCGFTYFHSMPISFNFESLGCKIKA